MLTKLYKILAGVGLFVAGFLWVRHDAESDGVKKATIDAQKDTIDEMKAKEMAKQQAKMEAEKHAKKVSDSDIADKASRL